MRKAFIALSAAMIFTLPAYAQTRVRADPWTLDPPMIRTPPSTEMGLARRHEYSSGPTRPAPLRDYNNPPVEYDLRNFNIRR
jgi:hypothetical protein